MRHYYCILSIIALAICFSGCKATKEAPVVETDTTMETMPVKILGTTNFIPKAMLYKTNGDYNQNVAVTLNASRTALMSYPAPTDVSVNSSALPVGNGWLLDRRGGVGPNTAFLTYTYSEYAALKSAPSPKELMQCIIPDARVTQTLTLPVTLTEVLTNPESLTKYVP